MQPSPAHAPRRSLDRITFVLGQFALIANASDDANLDPSVPRAVAGCLTDLRDYIPGLNPLLPRLRARINRRQQRAEKAIRDQDWPSAACHALRGLSLAPHDPKLLYTLACVFAWSKHLEAALMLYDQALWVRPDYFPARHDADHLRQYLYPHHTLDP